MKYIGIDIGGTKIAVILANSKGSILKRTEFKTVYDANQAFDKICDIIDSFKANFNAIGISIGGPLDYKNQVILNPPNLPGWENFNIVNKLAKKYNVEVIMDNDANCCAIAHKYWGQGVPFSNFAFLTFGTGMGSGLFLNNKIYHGKNGNSGEIGHIRISEIGSLNYFKNGSVESYCSGSGISNTYYNLTEKRLSAKDICKLAKNGEEEATLVINNSCKFLGRILAILVDILDLEAIIIGSIFSKEYDLFYSNTMKELEKEALAINLEDFILLPSSLSNMQDLAPVALCIHNKEINNDKIR